jgi:DNA-binding response OmpR family regulator
MNRTVELRERVHLAQTPGSDVPPIVLVVDDHPDTLALYDAVLTGHGYWVARAASGLEALECAQDLQPDVIVTDVGLSGDMDGTDLVRELRADHKLRNVPVLVVTGQEPRDLPCFIGLLISGLLVKPVAPRSLVSRVDQLLDRTGPVANSSAIGSRAQSAGDVAGRDLDSLPASASKVSKERRACPHCSARLKWVETQRLLGVTYDYYGACANGCGLFCYNRRTRTFELLLRS